MINIPEYGSEYHHEKVCVIGGGWYGCHVTAYLTKKGYKTDLLEKNHVLFGESSSKNQCRLHRGLHYVRSWSTRKECMEGYHQLVKLYPSSVKPVAKNYYVVSKKSPIDFRTILDILAASNIPHDVVEPEMNLNGWQGVIQCDEQVFDHLAAAEHFLHMLSDHIHFGVTVHDLKQVGDRVQVITNQGMKEYDYVIDCTYNQLERAQITTPCYYEPCLTFLFKYVGGGEKHPSVTVIDGDFVSLYEYCGDDENWYTLTSVKDTPLGQYDTWQECSKAIKNIDSSLLDEKREAFTTLIEEYVPDFRSQFEFRGHFVSTKTKFENACASRECLGFPSQNILTIFGGKITGIFEAERLVSNFMGMNHKRDYASSILFTVTNETRIAYTTFDFNEQRMNVVRYALYLDMVAVSEHETFPPKMTKQPFYFEPFLYSLCKPMFSTNIYKDQNTLFWILGKSDEKLSSLGVIRSKSKPERYSLAIKLIRKKATSCLLELSNETPFTPPSSPPLDVKELCLDFIQPLFEDPNVMFPSFVNTPADTPTPLPSPTKRKADLMPVVKRQRQDSGFEDCFC